MMWKSMQKSKFVQINLQIYSNINTEGDKAKLKNPVSVLLR